MSDFTAGVASRPNEITPPLVGAKLPGLEVFGAQGEGREGVALAVLATAQPTVLLYYRGNW